MRTIAKGREPSKLTHYRASPDATYDAMPADVKDDIRTQLCDEQRQLCCYCQSRIAPAYDKMKVEHHQCQHAHKNLQLLYTNLYGACYGGEGKADTLQHCDTRKGGTDISFSLINATNPIENQIKFMGNGEIHSENPAIHHDINQTLNLNVSHLVRNRKAVLDSFKARLGKGKLNPAQELQKWDGSKPGPLPEYAQVMVYWLMKKLKRGKV